MPRKDGSLTVREEDFISAYVRSGMDRVYAEKQAGYPENGGYRVLNRPEIRREIDARIDADLNEITVASSRWMLEKIKDPKAPDATKMKIADLAHKHYWSRREGAGEGGKEPHEMTADEIADQIAKLEGAASSKAKTVEDAEVVSETKPASSSPFE